MTVDGKITTKNYSPVDFTSREDKTHLLRQRALGDAVLIAIARSNTTTSALLARSENAGERGARGQTPYPLRVIISNEGRIDASLKMFQADPAKAGPIVIFFHAANAGALSESASRKSDAAFERRERSRSFLDAATASARVWRANCCLRGRRHTFPSVTRSGSRRSAQPDNCAVSFGGANAPTLTGLSKEFLPRSVRCSLTDMRVIGEECFLTYRIKHRRG